MRARVLETLRRAAGYEFPRLGRLGFRLMCVAFPREIVTELFPGIRVRLNLSDETQLATYWHGRRYEHPTGAVLENWCGEGATIFFDIGSNYGFYSYWMASSHPQLEIYAFEPNPPVFAILEETQHRNALTRLHPIPEGVADGPGLLDLHPGTANLGQSTFSPHPLLLGRSVANVKVRAFDDFCAEMGLKLPARPRWVAKIDVEGFDLKVLMGMRRALQAKAFKGISIEMNAENLGYCGASTAQVREFLAEYGYRPGFPPGLKAIRSRSPSDNEFFVPSS